MHFIELSDYTLAPAGSGYGINGFYFALSAGDVCTIDSLSPDDGNLFLRALATLVRPLKGIYKFKGQQFDLSNYRDLLSCKRKIGYIAPDAALISNMTLRQNLLMPRYYYGNMLNIELDDEIQTLCDQFIILDKLDRRPSELNVMDTQVAIAIREFSKKPDILLLDKPEDFMGHANFDLLVKIFNDLISDKMPVVFLSYDRRLIRRFANRKILITKGSLTTVAVKRPSSGA